MYILRVVALYAVGILRCTDHINTAASCVCCVLDIWSDIGQCTIGGVYDIMCRPCLFGFMTNEQVTPRGDTVDHVPMSHQSEYNPASTRR